MNNIIDNNYLPVPLKYTYPSQMIIRVLYKGGSRARDLYYLPEKGMWYQYRSLKVKQFNFNLWFNKWILKAIDPKNLTEDEIENLIKIKYLDKLPKTKEYIKQQLQQNPFYECDFLCLKEDLINEYYRSREGKEYCFNYNFSKVQKFIKNTTDKFTLSFKEFYNDREFSGEYETDYLNLIINKSDCIILSSGIIHSNFMKLTNEYFLKRAIEVHGDLYEYLDTVDN